MKTLLRSKAKLLGIDMTREMAERFDRYYEILMDWNNVMNLTSITEHEEVIEKHFIDSLSLINGVDVFHVKNLIDVGTGAGFPGIPLKIVFPHLKIVLIDSLNKRIKFLENVISELGLSDIRAIHGRAEDLARKPEYRGQFELCVSRAVARLPVLSEYCIPFVKKGGTFISYKSAEAGQEIRQSAEAVRTLGAKIDKIIEFRLPGTNIERKLVVITKERHTPAKYPRKAGLPAKEPLC